MNKQALIPRNETEVGVCLIEEPCCHFWRIGTPHGEHSPAVCKFCGEEREFNNGHSRNPKWEANHRLINK